MGSDGSNPRRLTDHSGWSPSWSPDGRQIAFLSYSDRDGNGIYVMDSDGSNPRNLTKSVAEGYYPFYSPLWSLDGRQIAFVFEHDGNREIYVMELNVHDGD